MPETDLHLTRVLNAPIADVYAAWTDPGRMAGWFFAGDGWSVAVANELRVGGAFSLAMRSADGVEFLCTGVYREIIAPTRLVFTWTSYAVSDTLVTLELQDLGGGRTQLSLLHEGLVDAAVRASHAEGWGGCLTNLEKALVAA